MKTLADLKRRLTVGVKAKITWSKYPHRYFDKVRAVKAVWSTGVLWEGNSQLRWGKASNYQFNPETPNRFTLLEDGEAFLSYEII